MIFPQYPFRIEFEIINSCNLNCDYCYMKPFTNIFPSFKNLKYLFKKTQKITPFEVILLGGEPFLREDILDIISLSNDIFNQGVGISSNGTLINKLGEKKLLKLKSLIDGNNSLQISIDSIDAKINNQIRGKTDDTVSGITILNNSQIPFSIGIVLTKINIGNIYNTVAILMNNFNSLKSINLEPLQPTVSIGNKYIELNLDPTEMILAYKKIEEIRNNIPRPDIKINNLIDTCNSYDSEIPLLNTYGFKKCTAGLLRSGVFSNGDVTPCLTIRDERLGNLYKESWKKIWKRAKERYLKSNCVGKQCQSNLLRKAPIKVKV